MRLAVCAATRATNFVRLRFGFEYSTPKHKSFKELVQRRVAGDAAFGEALLRGGIDTMPAGDVETGKAVFATGKAILRDSAGLTLWSERPAASELSNPLRGAHGDSGDGQRRIHPACGWKDRAVADE